MVSEYRKLSADDVLRKYSGKLNKQIKTDSTKSVNYSREYTKFKEEMAPELSRYENWCKTLGSKIKLKVSEKDREKIKKSLDIAHLDLEPWQPLTLSILSFLGVFFYRSFNFNCNCFN